MALFNVSEKAYLLLADGRIFEGQSFGKKGTAFGEVVFTTSMTAYQETLTNPSYYGQIIVQTFPLIGNYGVNDEDNESSRPYASGYIVREWSNYPSNFRSQGNINDFLIKNNIVGIHSIDTRSLTRLIRDSGVMNGVITTENVYEKKDELLKQLKEYTIANVVKNLTCKEQVVYKNANSKYKVVLLDFGCRKSIINEFVKRGCEVVVVPAETNAEEIKKINPDGIVLSNGPGDPAENTVIIENLKEISKLGIPMFGIALGHQLLALAHGGRTEKLKYGHRGSNQPVIDFKKDRTYITNQNHGYVVIGDSIDESIAEVSHINANDKTCEGLCYKNINAVTVQFYPDGLNGELDISYLYDEFIGVIADRRVQ